VDADGNKLEPTTDPLGYDYPKPQPVVQPGAFFGGWDIDPPAFAVYEASGPYYEVVTRDSTGSSLVNLLELHLLDNSGDPWNPGMHPEAPSATKGIRDASWGDAGDELGFKIEQSGVTPLTNAYNTGFVTDVNNLIYGGFQGVQDDSYFALTLSDAGYGWTELTELWITYDSTVSRITDLAGNLLPSAAAPIRCIEKSPPEIYYSLAVVDETRIFLEFSEKVFGNDVLPRIALQPNSFAYTKAGNSIAGFELLDEDPADHGATQVMLTLSAPLDAEHAADFSGTAVGPGADPVYDGPGNQWTQPHRATDVGMGVVDPLWATDGMQTSELYGGSPGDLLREFDGSGRLMDRDITLQARIAVPSQIGAAAQLYYDVDPPGAVTSGGFWLPTFVPGLTPKANTEARSVAPFSVAGALRDFTIPGGDPEVDGDVDVEFVIRMGNLFCARVDDPADPRTVAPWIIPVKDIIRQRGGVTILNNVINPEAGEKTVLNYVLERSGMVVIQVFDLKGDIVQILQRGRQNAGEYNLTWDGRNRGGRICARGIYFIKVVAPGIDETRKVLVVK